MGVGKKVVAVGDFVVSIRLIRHHGTHLLSAARTFLNGLDSTHMIPQRQVDRKHRRLSIDPTFSCHPRQRDSEAGGGGLIVVVTATPRFRDVGSGRLGVRPP